MIYTSYFGNWRNFPDGKDLVSIANYSPRGFSGREYSDLFPDQYLVSDFKNGIISEEDFAKAYIEQLEEIGKDKILNDLDGCILLCYEKSSDFCHRHILRKWLGEGEEI